MAKDYRERRCLEQPTSEREWQRGEQGKSKWAGPHSNPLVSSEDGLAESDEDGGQIWTKKLPAEQQLVGDDL